MSEHGVTDWMGEGNRAYGLYPPSRRTHGVYPDSEAAMQGAYDFARLLNGVPTGWVLYAFPKLGATALCSCRAEEMAAWQETRTQSEKDRPNG